MKAANEKKSKLWLWLVALMGLQLIAWTTWFIIASNHRVAEVPLVHGDPR